LKDRSFVLFEGGEEVGDAAGILFEVGRFSVDGGFQDRRGHERTSPYLEVFLEYTEEDRLLTHSRQRKEHREHSETKGQHGVDCRDGKKLVDLGIGSTN
jgi:hypothetical protein